MGKNYQSIGKNRMAGGNSGANVHLYYLLFSIKLLSNQINQL
jgi:hypothetical protein